MASSVCMPCDLWLSRRRSDRPRVGGRTGQPSIAAITADRFDRVADIANMAVVIATDEPGMITGQVYQMDSMDRHFSTALALSVPAKQTTGWLLLATCGCGQQLGYQDIAFVAALSLVCPVAEMFCPAAAVVWQPRPSGTTRSSGPCRGWWNQVRIFGNA